VSSPLRRLPPGKVGPNWGNLASKYTWDGHHWGSTTCPLTSLGDPKLELVNQLYIRQALQESTDQTGVVKTCLQGLWIPVLRTLPAIVPAVLSKTIAKPVSVQPHDRGGIVDLTRLDHARWPL